MPPRLVSVCILLYWSLAAIGLAHRDLLPELNVGGPPDLRTISAAGEDAGPARWNLMVIADASKPDGRRSVGQATTEARRRPDGWVEMSSKVSFDSGRLLKGTPLANRTDDQVEFSSTYQVDPSGPGPMDAATPVVGNTSTVPSDRKRRICSFVVTAHNSPFPP